MHTYYSIAKEQGVCAKTVSRWASKKIPARRRLVVQRLGHRTVRITEANYRRFLEASQ